MTDDLVKRLDILWYFLDEEGYDKKANTVSLAKNRIEDLEARVADLEARLGWVWKDKGTPPFINVDAADMKGDNNDQNDPTETD